MEPVRILRAEGKNADGTDGGEGSVDVLGPRQFMTLTDQSAIPGSSNGSSAVVSADEKDVTVDAMVLPVGDALQEPNWTQGLGINRGFHTAMNQAFACMLAREQQSLKKAVEESCAMHKCVLGMKWGSSGNSGLAGSGSGNIGLKPFKQWDSDPRNRLPY